MGTSLPSADPQGKGGSMPDKELEPQHSLGPPDRCYSSCLCVAVPGFVSNWIVFLPLPSFLMFLFLCIFYCGRVVLIAFRLFSEEVVLPLIAALVCSQEEVS